MKEYLTEKEECGVEKITEACNRADGTCYAAPLDADAYFLSCHEKKPVAFLAVYRMGDTVDGRPVDELMLFTDPAFRGRHRAERLLKKYLEAGKILAGEKEDFASGIIPAEEKVNLNDAAYPENPVLRFCAYPAEDTEAFLVKLGAQHMHDELLMKLELPVKSPKTEQSPDPRKNRKAGRHRLKEQDLTFSNAYSECSVKTYGTVGYIYGVRTDESHLREGSAARLLEDTFQKLADMGADAAILEVSSANLPAYRLYRKLGFEVTQTLEIWQRV